MSITKKATARAAAKSQKWDADTSEHKLKPTAKTTKSVDKAAIAAKRRAEPTTKSKVQAAKAAKATTVKVKVAKTPELVKGAKVTALWDDGKRYGGKVHAIKGDKILIAWADGTKPSVGQKVKAA